MYTQNLILFLLLFFFFKFDYKLFLRIHKAEIHAGKICIILLF